MICLTNERHLALFPAAAIIRVPHHCESLRHAASRTWICAGPEFRLWWIKLCSSDNHCTTASLLFVIMVVALVIMTTAICDYRCCTWMLCVSDIVLIFHCKKQIELFKMSSVYVFWLSKGFWKTKTKQKKLVSIAFIHSQYTIAFKKVFTLTE